MDFALRQVDPDKLHLVWNTVLPGVEHIRKRNTGATFRPDQVYQAIRQRRAELFVGLVDGGTYAGFVILAEAPETFTGEIRLLIWCAYTARKRGDSLEISKRSREAVYQIAKERGISKCFFISSRKGWDRMAPAEGWRVAEITYEKEVK